MIPLIWILFFATSIIISTSRNTKIEVATPILICVALILTIVFIGKIVKLKDEVIDSDDRELRYLDDRLTDLKSQERHFQYQIDQYLAKINKLEEELATALAKHSEACREYEAEKQREDEICSMVTKKSAQMFELLNYTYSTLLDVSDWQHVDLVIAAIETGRADSMKEALHMLDRQVQTNEIVKATAIASQKIASAIFSNAAKIASMLTEGFIQLSQQMDTMSRQLNAIGRQTGHISEQIADTSQQQIETQQNLQLTTRELMKALNAKANESSEKLMEDVNYIRKLAEDAEPVDTTPKACARV